MASYFDNAQTVREGAASTYKTEFAMAATAIAALAAAVAANAYSTTMSVSGGSAQDVEHIMTWLTRLNFTVSISGSTLAISW